MGHTRLSYNVTQLFPLRYFIGQFHITWYTILNTNDQSNSSNVDGVLASYS